MLKSTRQSQEGEGGTPRRARQYSMSSVKKGVSEAGVFSEEKIEKGRDGTRRLSCASVDLAAFTESLQATGARR